MAKLIEGQGHRYGWREAFIYPVEYFDQPLSGVMKVWNGSAWVVTPPRVWDGAQWVACPVKVWTGSAWAPF